MLQPLLELKVAFAGLQESGLTVELVEAGNTTLRATASHSDYRGSGGRAVLFRGIQGSAGNLGGAGVGGGEGFGGGPGVFVVIQGGADQGLSREPAG